MSSLEMVVDSASAAEAGSEASIGMNWNREKARKWDPYENGEFSIPNLEMPNEVNFLGGIGPNVGHPRSTQNIQRPTKIQQLYNMRTRNQPVFTFCEDPRKANNVVQKKEKIDHTNVKRIKETVDRIRLAQNVETPPPSDFSEDPTEIFDSENPLNLDLQGLDRKETFQKDEQEFQNKKEYLIQKRNLNKRNMTKTLRDNWNDEKLQELYGLPPFFDINATIKGDEELISEKIEQKKMPWTEKYRVKRTEHEVEFQRPIPEAIPYVPPPLLLADLVRTRDKPANIQIEQEFKERQLEKLTNMQKHKQRKEENLRAAEKQKRAIEKEKEVITFAEKDFEKHFTDEFGNLQSTFQNLPPIYHEHKYPHTLRETKYLHRQMNRSRRVIRDETIMRNEFELARNADDVHIRDNVDADIGSDIDAAELSEQSTDDEDTLNIGQHNGSGYRLRGFHYKMGDNMRGLFNVKPQSKLDRPVRMCITRSDWFDQMAPTRVEPAFFKDNRSSIPSKALPSDPDYKIFTVSCIKPRDIAEAPIHEMVHGDGEEPKILNPKTPKIKKPKYVKVRKFNLTAYMFGKQKRVKYANKTKVEVTENKYGVSNDMIQKCDIMFRRKKNRNRKMRHNRMRTLGIPIVTWSKGEDEQPDEDDNLSSSSSDCDWVPEKDVTILSKQSSLDRSDISLSAFRNANVVTEVLTENAESPNGICAPDFREPTFRQYVQRSNSNAADESPFSQRHPYDVPRLSKLASDLILHPNLEVKRTQFTDLFACRFHHPHQDATQHKSVYVKYLPKIPQFQLPPAKKERAERIKPFQRAWFRDGKPLQEDLALPKIVLPQQVSGKEKSKLRTTTNQERANCVQIHPSIPQKSRPKLEQMAEKAPFIKLLKTLNHDVVAAMGELKVEQQVVIDQLEMMQRLRDELDSIKSCNSSQTSSQCTNFTKDSGSYFELEGHKVPCDYVNKSNVPFEEVDRCRVVTGPLERQDEYFGPFYRVPFSGQKMDMRQLSLPKDRFFNSSVRSRYGIRNRLQVKVAGFDFDSIGVKNRKMISQLATEWDSYYQNEILTRPRVRKFKPTTVLTQARDALRKKFVSNYIQEAITEHTIVAELENRYCGEVEQFRDVCLPLFSKWQETYYRAYMRKMQEVKPYYELTDQLKTELQTMRDDYTKMNMAIIYMEDDWRRRTIMQNFHYLLADPDWRQASDWIHRHDDNTLENYRTSIMKRPFVNVRIRDKDSAWAVKEFYEQFFENEKARTVHIVFPSARDFLCGLLKLKMKSFMCLLELHFAMWVLSNLSHGHRSFQNWANAYIAKRKKFVKGRCAKKYFTEDLASNLLGCAHDFVAEPLLEAVGAPLLRTLIALCETMFVQMIPRSVRDNMKSGADVVDKFTMIVNAAMQLFDDLEYIPHDLRVVVERKVRLNRAFITRQSVRACDLELRIKLTAVQMRKSLAPPSKPKPPQHPLPRSHLPVRVVVQRDTKMEITDLDKLFYKAFTNKPPQHMDFQSADDAAILRSLEANCIPFYFDYFLRQRNYFPVYDFKTEIEMLEGSEFKQFHYEDVLDDVHRLLKEWERHRQRLIEEHVIQTWHLYRLKDDE